MLPGRESEYRLWNADQRRHWHRHAGPGRLRATRVGSMEALRSE